MLFVLKDGQITWPCGDDGPVTVADLNKAKRF